MERKQGLAFSKGSLKYNSAHSMRIFLKTRVSARNYSFTGPKRLKPRDIEVRLVSFIGNFMSDSEFARRLNSDIYPNVVLKYVFTEYNEHLRGSEYSLQELMEQSETVPTIEHIFSREEKFDFPNFGFGSLEEYEVARLSKPTLKKEQDR